LTWQRAIRPWRGWKKATNLAKSCCAAAKSSSQWGQKAKLLCVRPEVSGILLHFLGFEILPLPPLFLQIRPEKHKILIFN
jgi:hypothetical protein